MINLIGFSPDLEPDAPGGIPICSNIIPSDRGIRPLPGLSGTGTDALPAACRGAIQAKRTDGGTNTLAGTASNLYSLGGTTWTSIDTATLGTEERWRFTQWGNYTFIATPFQTVAYFDGTTLTAISETVKASYITTVAGFVMVANYNDGTDDIPDGWMCSAYQDGTDWTIAAATQCANGRLLDASGKITGLVRLGDYAVIYRESSLYLGVYAPNPPVVWSFQKVSGEIGCLSEGLVVNNEQYHLFFGNDDLYRFDGSNLTALQAACSRFVIDSINRLSVHACQAVWDNDRGIAWWFYPDGSNTTCNRYVCLHPDSGRWGYGSLTVEAVINYAAGGYTYGTIPTDWTYETIPAYSYESSFWTGSGKPVLSIFDSTHTAKTVSALGVSSSMTLSEMGNDLNHSLVSRFYPRFFIQPDSATITVSAKWDANDDWEEVITASPLDRGKFDILTSALYHRFTIDLTGDYEIQGYEIDINEDGSV